MDEVDDAIILDNDAEGTSSEGLWFRVSNEDDWGLNFRVTTSTESNATYRFRVDVPSAREYEVFLWWPSSNQLSDRVVAEVVRRRKEDGPRQSDPERGPIEQHWHMDI